MGRKGIDLGSQAQLLKINTEESKAKHHGSVDKWQSPANVKSKDVMNDLSSFSPTKLDLDSADNT